MTNSLLQALSLSRVKGSLALQLLKVVFSIYLIITMFITALQMKDVYDAEKSSIKDNLIAYEKIFGQSISNALWNIDTEQVNATLNGIQKLNDVAGVRLADNQANILYLKGEARALESEHGKATNDLFSHTFPVMFDGAEIGKMNFYSSNRIVFGNVKEALITIVINAIIKTVVLWLLFLWAFNKYLVTALDQFISIVESTSLDTLNPEKTSKLSFKAREFIRLEVVFNDLLRRINQANESLKSLNKVLESKVEERTLQLSNQKLMLESMSLQGKIGAWEFDLETNTFYWSNMTKLIFEVSDSFEPTQELTILFFKEGEHRNQIRQAFDNAIENGTFWELTAQVVTEKGNTIWVKATGQAIMLGNKCLRLFGSIQNIDQAVKTQDELRAARDEAESANKTKSEFLASMSHEIRTPMNGVIGMLDVLKKSDLKDEQFHQLDIAHSSATSLQLILNDILDFSKMEAGKFLTDKIEFSLSRILEESIALWHDTANSKGVQLNYQLSMVSDAPEKLIGDPSRIKQIISNLISNALKFTKDGSVKLDANLSSSSNENYLLKLTVTDTGIGITKAKQKHIFEHFSQVDASTTREYGGTGLGLAIVKNLCHLMGGEISVESIVGKGSTFKLTLPLEPGTSSSGQTSQTSLPHTDNILSNANGPILIVEDNKVNQLVTKTMLDQFGVESEIAENGSIAIDMLNNRASTPYALIIMDCQMPVMDGFETTRAIRSGEAGDTYKNTRILALTANAMTGDKEKCLDAGMDDYLSKPLNSEDLRDKLSQLLQTA